MGVMREYRCFGHGFFESEEPRCPRGCTTVERAFLTAPGHYSKKTAAIDATFKQIAKDYRLSDMNNRDGKPARVVRAPQGEARAQQDRFSEMLQKRYGAKSVVHTQHGVGGWGGVNPGGIYRAGGEIVEAQRGPGAPAAVAAIGAPPENAVEGVKDALVRPRVTVIRDPENLKIA